MDGQSFVSKLQSLNIDGAESLKASDFSWIFSELDQNQSSTHFWNWFCSNVNPDDVLSKEELSQYESLVSSNSVLSDTCLDQLESCLGSSLEEDFPLLDFESIRIADNQEKNMERELTKLQTRKNIMSLQRLELEGRVDKKMKYIQSLRNELELKKTSALTSDAKFKKTLEQLVQSFETVSSTFKDFKDPKQEAQFMLQFSLEEFDKEENLYKEALDNYIHKQFETGVDAIAGQRDDSPYCLLDAGQIDLQFVRGPKKEEYIQHAKELNRISKMLEEAEGESIECELRNAHYGAALAETTKFVKMLRTDSSLSSSPIIRERVSRAREMVEALKQELDFNRKALKEKALVVAQEEKLRVLTGNYEVKLQRQEYYLRKQGIVFDFLLKQLVRYNFLKIVYDIEKGKIESVLEILQRINQVLSHESESENLRLAKVEKVKEFHHTGEATRSEREILSRIVQPTSSETENIKMHDVFTRVRNLDAVAFQSEKEISDLSKEQMHTLSKLYKKCSLLEECLFGPSKSIGTLPLTWIDSNILERIAEQEQLTWELHQEMIQVLKDLEHKKKIIRTNQGIHHDQLKWMKQINF